MSGSLLQSFCLVRFQEGGVKDDSFKNGGSQHGKKFES